MKSIYALLAPVYDRLNEEIDYESWADYTGEVFSTYAKREIRTVLDLGCGTGSMTLPLARRGFDMIGLDLSPEMLTVARTRAEEEDQNNILWTMQSMTGFELMNPVDAVVCTLDGINHLTSKKDLEACFACVNRYLAPGGVFVFDVNSRRKFEEIYGDEVYALETEGAFCVWQNAYRPSTHLCRFYITLFSERANGSYGRSDAVQSERYYPLATLEKALSGNGMKLLAAFGGQDYHAICPQDERWYIVAGKAE